MKVYLAGTSTLKNHPDVLKESKYFLESFYSIKEWQMGYLLQAEDFLLDSGAFSFMNSGKQNDFEKYIKRYAEFINHYRIEKFFELDIESVVGWDEYVRLNNLLCKMTYRLPIPVFHKERGKKWFLDALDRYPYIAYGGIAVDRKTMKKRDLEIIKWFLQKAREKNVKMHGLGFTSTQLFKSIRFDTVDSTTWSMGGRMGNLCYMSKDGTMKQWYPSRHKKAPKNIDEINVFNFLQWCKFQEYAERKL